LAFFSSFSSSSLRAGVAGYCSFRRSQMSASEKLNWFCRHSISVDDEDPALIPLFWMASRCICVCRGGGGGGGGGGRCLIRSQSL